MLSFRKPTPRKIQRFLDEQQNGDFTYAAVGATATTPPDGYLVDHTRVELGQGEEVFRRAAAALRQWRQFHLGWVEPWPGDTHLAPGEVVVIVARTTGIWWLNACRIVYVVDEQEVATTHRFGFAYGTLPGHAETGEERFLIEWNQNDDRVSYDILAFSRPRHPLARLGYPVVRQFQRRFAQDSGTAMLQAVESRD